MDENINTTHEQAVLKIIEEKKLMRFDHIWAHYKAISRTTAYNHGLDKLNSIKSALELNRHKGVDYMLQKWISSDNPTLQIAAMRLICTSEEHQLLNQQNVNHSGSIVNYNATITKEEAKAISKALNDDC